MVQSDMDRLGQGKPAKRGVTERATDASAPLTARIERWGDDGAYCTPIVGDLGVVSTDSVVGPCMGGLVRDVRNCTAVAHTHALVRLPLRTVVLLVPTPGGLWISSYDTTTSGGL